MPDWNVVNTSLTSIDALYIAPDPADQQPQIVAQHPLPNATDVEVNSLISVSVYCPGMRTAPYGWSRLKLSNFGIVLAHTDLNGSVTVGTDVLGVKYTEVNDLHTVHCLYRNFDYETTYKLEMGARGATNIQSEWGWEFTTKSNAAYYDGHTPLEIELALQTPFTTFLDLEPLRKTFLQHALRPSVPMYDNTIQDNTVNAANSINEKANKAVRVLYQHAFITELKTLQNKYGTKNATAIAQVVAEKNNTLSLDKELMPLKDHLLQGIQALQTARVYPEEYATTFMDYLDSTLYTYRVSLIANILLMAKAVELQNM